MYIYIYMFACYRLGRSGASEGLINDCVHHFLSSLLFGVHLACILLYMILDPYISLPCPLIVIYFGSVELYIYI